MRDAITTKEREAPAYVREDGWDWDDVQGVGGYREPIAKNE